MKILFVTTDEYPYFGTTSNLINKLIFDGGLIRTNEISVLSFCNNYSLKSFEEIEGVKVYRILSYSFLQGDCFWIQLNELPIYKRLFPFFGKILWWLHEVTGKCSRLYRPDNVRKLKQTLEKIVDGNYDYVVPVSGNYDSAVAVLRSDISAKKVFWQVDPCSTNYIRLKREAKLSKKIEEQIIKSFDHILTEEIYYSELVNIYGDDIKKNVHVFPFPLIDCSLNTSGVLNNNSGRHIECLFPGLIYLGIRDPGYTFRLFEGFNKELGIRLNLYGPDKTVVQSENEAIVLHDRVQIDEMREIIRNADFLVNIGNKMVNQIPSKIYEYISTGLPIINICKNRDCPTIKLLENYSNSISLIEEDELFDEQLHTLEQFILSHRGIKTSVDEIQRCYSKYFPENCADLFITYLL